MITDQRYTPFSPETPLVDPTNRQLLEFLIRELTGPDPDLCEAVLMFLKASEAPDFNRALFAFLLIHTVGVGVPPSYEDARDIAEIVLENFLNDGTIVLTGAGDDQGV